MIRILELLGEPLATGGEESYIVSHIGAMDRDGLSFDVLTPYSCESENNRRTIESWGGCVYELDLPFRPGRSREALRNPLRRFLKMHRYDVVHVHSGSMSVFAIGSQVAKQCGVSRVIVHSHSSGERPNVKKQLVKLACGLSMRGSVDEYCACSRKAGKAKFLPSAQRKMHIVPNGVDLDRFSFDPVAREKIRLQVGVDDHAIVVGHVGRMAPEKNDQFIVRAFDRLHDAYPDSELWLVGDGPERDDTELIVHKLGLDDAVRFWGMRRDTETLLSGMDVFLLPSLWEGFPISLVEAQATGLPCLASNGVTSEADLCEGFIRHLSLDVGCDTWAENMLDYAGMRNTRAKEQITDAGYSLDVSSLSLRAMYTGCDEFRA